MPATKTDRENSPITRLLKRIALTVGLLFTLCAAVYSVTVVWTRTVNGPSDGFDSGHAVSLSSTGQLYAVGMITTNLESGNIWIRKYTSAGAKLWTRTINGSANDHDEAIDVAVDSIEHVYVVGYKAVTGQEENIWIRKYGSGGSTVWTRTVDGPTGGPDLASGVALDCADNVYVAGYVSVASQSRNIWIRKYASNGHKLWTRTVNGAANGSDGASDVTVDCAGNTYVVGYLTASGQSFNIWLRKYDSNGTKQWTRTLNGPANGTDVANGATLDTNGNLYVVGYITISSGNSDIWIRKYSPSGAKLWSRVIDGSFGGRDYGHGVTTDSNNAVYVIGEKEVSSNKSSAWIRKYSSGGTARWTRSYSGSDGDASGNDIAVNPNKRVFVTGRTLKSGQDDNIWIRKYRP